MQGKMPGCTYSSGYIGYSLGFSEVPLVTDTNLGVFKITQFFTSLIHTRKVEGDEDFQGINISLGNEEGTW